VIVTEPRAVVFVKTKKSAIVPVPVLISRPVTPAEAATGEALVAREVIMSALTATTETTVPVSTPVKANLTASAASTELSAGTVTVAGVAATAAVVTAVPFTETAIVGTEADAGATDRKEPASAAATSRDIFLIKESP
jgi:hypothetical protein